MQTIKFIGFWVINSIIIWFVGQLAPNNVVLGNQHVSAIQASVFAAYVLSTLNILVQPTLKLLKIKTQNIQQWAALLATVNSLGFWIVTRLALIIGVGISNFWWAGILGVTTTLGQLTVWTQLKDKGKS